MLRGPEHETKEFEIQVIVITLSVFMCTISSLCLIAGLQRKSLVHFPSVVYRLSFSFCWLLLKHIFCSSLDIVFMHAAFILAVGLIVLNFSITHCAHGFVDRFLTLMLKYWYTAMLFRTQRSIFLLWLTSWVHLLQIQMYGTLNICFPFQICLKFIPMISVTIGQWSQLFVCNT